MKRLIRSLTGCDRPVQLMQSFERLLGIPRDTRLPAERSRYALVQFVVECPEFRIGTISYFAVQPREPCGVCCAEPASHFCHLPRAFANALSDVWRGIGPGEGHEGRGRISRVSL